MGNDETLARLRPKLMAFDVFGTLISVRDSSYGAFERILADAGAHGVDVRAFWEHWEHRNIAHYWETYRSYRDICELSLAETFAHFELHGDSRLIRHYFEAFPNFFLYDDVVRTLDRLSRSHQLAIVSNIDDDLLALTPGGALAEQRSRARDRCVGWPARGRRRKVEALKRGVPARTLRLHRG